MGRHFKSVFSEEGIDRRDAGYYSSPDFVARFLCDEMRSINPAGTTVFDPCVGKEELLEPFIREGLRTEGFDCRSYLPAYRSRFRQIDFLEFFRNCTQHNEPAPEADFIVANPPYNCHETNYIRDNKPWLRKLFAETGVANMYSMFISALIDLAKPGAVIGLLSFDSFLTAGAHARLRAKILRQCRVHHLILCPTDLFRSQGADVRTCLMILEKRPSNPVDAVSVSNRPRDVNSFKEILDRKQFKRVSLGDIVLSGTLDASEFVIDCPDDVLCLFQFARLGSYAQVITGISTGNDGLYLRSDMAPGHDVPFYKNPGSRKFYCSPDAFLPADFQAIAEGVPNFIVRNRDLLFRSGIICSSMGVKFGACHLPAGGTFGVNPGVFCDDASLWWLLAYLNSSLVHYLVRGVLLRTNMITSGYVARIPVVPFDDESKPLLAKLARQAYELEQKGASGSAMQLEIDRLVFERSGLSSDSRQRIDNFCKDIVRLA